MAKHEWFSIYENRTRPVWEPAANIAAIRKDSQTFEVILDTQKLFIWRWKVDEKLIVYIHEDLLLR